MSGTSMELAQQMRQKQVLAPQMRQSLEVLQLQVQDLRQLAQQELEQNPTLEELDSKMTSIDAEREQFEGIRDADDPDPNEELFGAAPSGGTMDYVTVRDEDGEGQGEDSATGEDIPLDDFRVLSELDDVDYLYQDGGNNEYNPDLEERRQFMFDSIQEQESLQEHLLDQLELSNLSEEDRLIAEQIIGSISDDGYLRTPLADVAQVIPGVTLMDCERVLVVVQDFTPAGVGARDLRECLLIQIRQGALAGTFAEALVRDHLALLESRQIAKIARQCEVSQEKVESALASLARLEPRPGTAFDRVSPTYVVPEVEVRKVEGRYQAFVGDTDVPHLRISRKYSALLSSPATDAETREYVQGKIRSGVNLIRSIEQRQETIRKVAQQIVEAQQAFFDDGIRSLRPLVMSDIASAVNLHETTVSRTVSNKYMRSPQGIHELRFFFTNGIPTESGDAVSSEHVKLLIKAMVEAEDPTCPLADQDIEKNLADRGINIARRTIAKYRGILRIPASHVRRQQ